MYSFDHPQENGLNLINRRTRKTCSGARTRNFSKSVSPGTYISNFTITELLFIRFRIDCFEPMSGANQDVPVVCLMQNSLTHHYFCCSEQIRSKRQSGGHRRDIHLPRLYRPTKVGGKHHSDDKAGQTLSRPNLLIGA